MIETIVETQRAGFRVQVWERGCELPYLYSQKAVVISEDDTAGLILRIGGKDVQSCKPENFKTRESEVIQYELEHLRKSLEKTIGIYAARIAELEKKLVESLPENT